MLQCRQGRLGELKRFGMPNLIFGVSRRRTLQRRASAYSRTPTDDGNTDKWEWARLKSQGAEVAQGYADVPITVDG